MKEKEFKVVANIINHHVQALRNECLERGGFGESGGWLDEQLVDLGYKITDQIFIDFQRPFRPKPEPLPKPPGKKKMKKLRKKQQKAIAAAVTQAMATVELTWRLHREFAEKMKKAKKVNHPEKEHDLS